MLVLMNFLHAMNYTSCVVSFWVHCAKVEEGNPDHEELDMVQAEEATSCH